MHFINVFRDDNFNYGDDKVKWIVTIVQQMTAGVRFDNSHPFTLSGNYNSNTISYTNH